MRWREVKCSNCGHVGKPKSTRPYFAWWMLLSGASRETGYETIGTFWK
ncbi:MAG: hypothetical protein V1858_05245 [Candidatus Gottesmanbacteria bacterium]